MEKDKLKVFLTRGAEFAGALVGTTLSLPGDPLAIIGGGIAGVFIKNEIKDFMSRVLSDREQTRVGGATILALKGIDKNLQNGLEYRKDDFFDANQIKRSKAEELFEGVLHKCKNTFEERKIQYIANIYINTAFDPMVDVYNANQVLQTVEQFSYRQLCILALIGQNEQNKFLLRTNDLRNKEVGTLVAVDFLLQDFIALDNEGLINRDDNTMILHASDVAPGITTLTPVGRTYYKLLGLDSMPEEEFYFLKDLR